MTGKLDGARKHRPGRPDGDRRTQLIGVAGELFAERGFDATTVRDIAEAAGMLSGSLYHHFASKEAIVDAILSEFLETILERYERIAAMDVGPRAKVELLINASIDAIRDRGAAITIYQNDYPYLADLAGFEYLRAGAQRIRGVWVEALRDGIACGELRADVDPRLVYRFVRGAIWNAARWYRPGGPLELDEMAAEYLRVVVHGIAFEH
jgi:AcrR family transcriptional regulator